MTVFAFAVVFFAVCTTRSLLLFMRNTSRIYANDAVRYTY
jgi:hypothetical protein